MFYPKLKPLKEKCTLYDKFGGVCLNSDVPETKFSDMCNLTSDCFPLMKTRDPRGMWTARFEGSDDEYPGMPVVGNGITAVANVSEVLCFCTDSYVCAGETLINDVNFDKNVVNRCAVPMGRNLFIAPDGEYIVLSDTTPTVLHGNVSFTCQDGASVGYCLENGVSTGADLYDTLPETSPASRKAVVKEDGNMYLYEYKNGTAVLSDNVYIKINANGVGNSFSADDTVFVKGASSFLPDGRYTVKESYENALLLTGVLTASGSIKSAVLEKKIPLMDFAVEHNNRIWGCRYGLNKDGEFVNEIYASVLGEPLKWYDFRGISTDSYVASLGCSGEFTGVAALGSEVLFFKENYIIRVTGTSPSDFCVYSFPARGVSKGDFKSVVNLNEKVFYKSRTGITVYDGAMPFDISSDLGNGDFTDAVAGGYCGKYYIALTDTKGVRSMFVYDTATGQWFKEDDIGNTRFAVAYAGCLYFVGLKRKFEVMGIPFGQYFIRVHDVSSAPEAENIFADNSSDDGYEYAYEEENPIEWYAVTGKLGTEKDGSKSILRSIDFTLSLKKGSVAKISILPDGEKEWKCIFVSDTECDKVISVPVSTPPCHTFRLKFEGKGEFTLCNFVTHKQISGRYNGYET